MAAIIEGGTAIQLANQELKLQNQDLIKKKLKPFQALKLVKSVSHCPLLLFLILLSLYCCYLCLSIIGELKM